MVWQCFQIALEHLIKAATEVRVFAKQGHLFGKNLHLCGSLNFELNSTLNTLVSIQFCDMMLPYCLAGTVSNYTS